MTSTTLPANPLGTASNPLDPERRRSDGALASARAFVASHAQVISLATLLGATALLYLVGLSASGYANEFYSAAAQAGSTNWWSFLWGSSDAGNSITVDKPPAALWPMALSVRIFGLSSWAILVPQAIMGVLSVWVLYATVRRAYGHWAGILAGAVLATTPIACLMFRFNNPDALLVLLLLVCVYCVLRACDLPDERAANRSRTRWMALAGVAMGFAFLTKQLQAFLILPGIGVAFLVASPTRWHRKLVDTLAAFGALVVSAGWWVLLTVVVPTDQRPYIGGSQTNSFLELTFSYNGLGRITGSMEGAVLPGGSSTTTTISTGQAGMWGQTGITRLLDGVWGTQWSWLVWVALAGIAIGFACTRGEGRRSLRRSHLIVWGSWLLVTGLVFSFMGGTIHQYYTVALAPAVAALVAICLAHLWESREARWAQLATPGLTAATAVWSVVLLERSDWAWQLRPTVLALAAGAVVLGVLAWRSRKSEGRRKAEVLERACLALALASALVGPVAYSLYTASTGHTGSIVTAGPAVSGDSGMGGGPGGQGQGGPKAGGMGQGGQGSPKAGGPSADGSGAGGPNADGSGAGSPSGQGDGSGQVVSGTGDQGGMGQDGSGAGGPNADGSGAGDPNGGQGGMAGLLGGGTVSDELTSALQDNASSYRWVAATVGSQNAASYQLATECPVMPIGGFNGSDPSPTLEQFQEWVQEGQVHYFIGSGMGGATQIGGSDDASQIAQWVAQNYTSTTIGGVTVYDLTQAAS